MPVVIEIENNTVTAKLQGEIDHHNAPSLRSYIYLAAEKHHPEELILDFGEVNFMDSSGIGLVMGRYKAVRTFGGKVIIRNAPAQIKKVMRLAGMDRLAEIE